MSQNFWSNLSSKFKTMVVDNYHHRNRPSSLLQLLYFLLVVVNTLNILFLSTSVLAQEQTNTGLVVSPAMVELEVERGGGYDVAIDLLNNSGSEEYKIKTLLQGFTASKEDGVPVVADLPSDSVYHNWIDFQEKTFVLKDKEKAVSTVRLNIPQDAQPGSHYLALTYTINNPNFVQNLEKPQVNLLPRIAVMLFLNVKGQIQREVSFEYIQADKNTYDPFFDGAMIEYRIKLDGNAYLKPNGNIYIGNDPTQPDASVTLNPEAKIVIPNTARSFQFYISPVYQLPFLTTGIIDPTNLSKDPNNTLLNLINNLNRPWFGNQKVEARVLFVDSQGELTQRSATLDMFYFPWKMLLILSFILVILILIAVWWHRQHKITILR